MAEDRAIHSILVTFLGGGGEETNALMRAVAQRLADAGLTVSEAGVLTLTNPPTFTNALGVASGGTGATTAADARTSLGVAIGSDVQAYDADVAAVAALASTGLVARTGAGTVAARTLTAGSNKVSIGNGDGVSANPSVDVTEANLTLDNIGGTLGISKGGTNSTAALNNSRLMKSAAGAIVEADALTDGQLFIGSTNAAPVAASLTAGSGVTITPAAGSITIAATAVGSKLLDKLLDDVAADDTTNETTLYTFNIPANTIGTTRALRLTLLGEVSNVSVAGATWTAKITFGGTAVASGASAGINAGVDDAPWKMECVITPNGATNSQRAHTLRWHAGTDETSGVLTAQANPYQAYNNALAIDTTAQVTIAFTAQMSTATDMTVTLYAALLELLQS